MSNTGNATSSNVDNDNDDQVEQVLLEEIKNCDDEPDLSSSESKEEAESKGLQCKDEGNVALMSGHYNEAVHHYSTALSHLPGNAIVLSNRALAYIKLENYGLAIQDATHAIEADPNYPKGIIGGVPQSSRSAGPRRLVRTSGWSASSVQKTGMLGPS